MTFVAELRDIREKLNAFIEGTAEQRASAAISTLEEAGNTIGKAWSGSWLGYQSCVYYANLEPPPAGAQFSIEWGFKKLRTIRTTTGEWNEFTFDEIRDAIFRVADMTDIEAIERNAARASGLFGNSRTEVLSILQIDAGHLNDPYVERLLQEVRDLKVLKQAEIQDSWTPTSQVMTRDSLAVTEGLRTPPHISVLAQAKALRGPFESCFRLMKIIIQAISHMERRDRARARAERVGTNVFIGHGRSLLWRELKDYLQDRLKLRYDEYNRVPVAGITNIARLSQMLDAAAIALLVLTAEDEGSDGQLTARLNVVHEAGLFQGRLGFTKAIILLEEGCTEFSNIEGLGQIRFPKGQIKAAFDEVRRVLEREGVLPT